MVQRRAQSCKLTNMIAAYFFGQVLPPTVTYGDHISPEKVRPNPWTNDDSIAVRHGVGLQVVLFVAEWLRSLGVAAIDYDIPLV